MDQKPGKPFDPNSRWGTLRNAVDLYEQEDRAFSCKELSELARVPEKLVSSFLPRWTKVGVLAKGTMAPTGIAVWKKVKPWNYAAAFSKRRKSRLSKVVANKPLVLPPEPVSHAGIGKTYTGISDPMPSPWSQSEVTPLQIGIGVVELINSLRAGNGRAAKADEFRVQELKGQVQRAEAKNRQLEAAIATLKDNQVLMERHIEQLMTHIRGLSGAKGIKLSDIVSTLPKR